MLSLQPTRIPARNDHIITQTPFSSKPSKRPTRPRPLGHYSTNGGTAARGHITRKWRLSINRSQRQTVTILYAWLCADMTKVLDRRQTSSLVVVAYLSAPLFVKLRSHGTNRLFCTELVLTKLHTLKHNSYHRRVITNLTRPILCKRGLGSIMFLNPKRLWPQNRLGLPIGVQ